MSDYRRRISSTSSIEAFYFVSVPMGYDLSYCRMSPPSGTSNSIQQSAILGLAAGGKCKVLAIPHCLLFH